MKNLIHHDYGVYWRTNRCYSKTNLQKCGEKYNQKVVQSTLASGEVTSEKDEAFNAGWIVSLFPPYNYFLLRSDGAFYDGEWIKDRAEGNGKLVHSNGDVYDGEWVNDQANGQGKFIYSTGSVYEGQWMNDLQDGYGIHTMEDGSIYEGDFERGVKSGFGTFLWADGSSYRGHWDKNCLNGKGVYRWKDGRIYDGEWLLNYMHGYGKYTWADGRQYEGQYEEDLRSGFGVYIWKDGRKYEGQWKGGKQEGKGILIKTGKPQNISFGLFKAGKKERSISKQMYYNQEAFSPGPNDNQMLEDDDSFFQSISMNEGQNSSTKNRINLPDRPPPRIGIQEMNRKQENFPNLCIRKTQSEYVQPVEGEYLLSEKEPDNLPPQIQGWEQLVSPAFDTPVNTAFKIEEQLNKEGRSLFYQPKSSTGFDRYDPKKPIL